VLGRRGRFLRGGPILGGPACGTRCSLDLPSCIFGVCCVSIALAGGGRWDPSVFLKRCRRRKCGKGHVYWQLVESLVMTTLLHGTALAGSTGPAHHFSDERLPGNRSCVFCHTTQAVDAAATPLWNAELSGESFMSYGNPTSAVDARVDSPAAGDSAACLSCHDGSIALDIIGSTSGGAARADQAKTIGRDTSGNHPVGFTYDSALAAGNGALHDPSTTDSGLGGTIDQDMLFDGKMTCASCHDVHNGNRNRKLLIKSNSRSALCLTCHDR